MPLPASLLTPERPQRLDDARALLDRARRERVNYFHSPVDWRDEVLYFLLPDRFSDGQEAARPLLSRTEVQALRQMAHRPGWNWRQWADSGKRWQGGTINGIRGRLDYLKDLGITSLWVGPVFKQRARLDTYHGYGIQDFLEVDPRFGTRGELLDLVNEAHAKGIRIVLDIIVNHCGDNWGYVPPGAGPEQARNEPAYRPWPDYYGNLDGADGSPWRLAWRSETQTGFATESDQISGSHEGVWPRDLQSSSLYTRAGKGELGAGHIADPHAEHKRTDFFSLKDFALDVPHTLSFLADCYKYWIAVTDCDGFRIDTVKHMSLEETRNFCGAIREFADTLGKRNFLLLGEIAGGDDFQDFVLDNLAVLQRNMSAALDIGSARTRLHAVAKGLAAPREYLEMFLAQSEGFESHRSFGDRHVSILDDHDHVIGDKLRFSAGISDDAPVKDYQVAAAVAFQLFTLGIPCIYYGTEQAFAGPAHSQLQYLAGEGWNDGSNHGDRYLREAMFGPAHPRAPHGNDLQTQLNESDPDLPGFGPFGTAGKHCFDSDSPAYLRIAALCRARAQHPVLRLGRQYPRQVRTPGRGFGYPAAGELAAWSRILDNQEALCVVNPHGGAEGGGDVVVSAELTGPDTRYVVVVNTAQAAAGSAYSGSHPIGSTVPVKGRHGGSPTYIEVRNVQAAETVVFMKVL